MATLHKLIKAFFELYRPKSNRLHIIDPLTGLAVVSGVGKLIGGIIQKRKAKKLKPSTYVSPELQKAEAEANMMANSGEYTGQSQDQANIKQSTAQSIANASKVAGGAGELLNYASAAQGNENAAMRDVAKRALLWRDKAKQDRNAVRRQIAGQQDANMRQYQSAKSALLGASNTNIFSGATDLSGAALFSKAGGGNGTNPFIWGRNGKLGIPNAQ